MSIEEHARSARPLITVTRKASGPDRQTAKIAGVRTTEAVMPIRMQTTAITAITLSGTTTTTIFARAFVGAMKMATTAGIGTAAILTAHIAFLMRSPPQCS
jgi:hypothetical protein